MTKVGTDRSANPVTETIPVMAEMLAVSKRRIRTGRVRVSTRTDVSEEVREVVLDRTTVEVIRVPVGRVVDTVPELRVEGDTTIVPVLEERLVTIRQLVLVEEVHIRRRVEQRVAREPVSLRRQQVVVERFGADGQLEADPSG